MSTSVTIEHLEKFLKAKMKKGVYGSVQIHLVDGEVETVNDQTHFNKAAFIEHVEHPGKRFVVKNKGKKEEGPVIKLSENSDIVKKAVENPSENSVKPVETEAANDQN